jgi:glycosyltransferase involved in cell wall biosynthesis
MVMGLQRTSENSQSSWAVRAFQQPHREERMNRKGAETDLPGFPLIECRGSGGEPIFLEVSALFTRHLTGIGRHVARLVRALAHLAPLRLVSTMPADHARRLHMPGALVCGQEMEVTDRDLPPMDPNLDAWVRRLTHRPRRRHSAQLAKRSCCVFPTLRPAQRYFRREVSILHDFTPLIMPWAHVAGTCERFNAYFAEILGLSDSVVAVSNSTRADACWLGALEEEKVVVGRPGPSLCEHGHAFPGPVQRRPNVIVVVATLEPRKNGQFLLDWFLNARVFSTDMELWWVGPKGWLCEIGWMSRPRRRPGRRIRHLGMIPDRSLCRLYREAAFTIAPSLYEGFGFPVLDCLLHGTPVVSAFNSSLQEFAGPGVFYFDPCDPVSLDRACEDLQTSELEVVERGDLRQRYSWDGFARTVVSQCV